MPIAPSFYRITRFLLAVLGVLCLFSAPLLHAGTPKPPANLRTGPTSVDECAQMKAGWIFCSGFEEGNLAIWDDYDGNPAPDNLVMADPGPRNIVGNHVMRLRVPPGRGGVDLVKVLPSSHDRLYARWYVKWEPGYDFRALNHGGGLHAGSRSLLGRSNFRPNGADWFSAWIEPNPRTQHGPALNAYTYYRGMYMDCSDPNGSCWGDMFPCMMDDGSGYCTRPEHRESSPPAQLVTDRWYCIEMLMDGGTPTSTEAGANGVLNFWVDGVSSGPWNNLWLRTTSQLKLTILWLGLFFHGEHSAEGIMLDNIVVSTDRIGCL